jgi:hypothetical protein
MATAPMDKLYTVSYCMMFVEIYRQLIEKYPRIIRPTFSESIDEERIGDELTATIQKCWAEEPSDRPSFQALKSNTKLNKLVISQ